MPMSGRDDQRIIRKECEVPGLSLLFDHDAMRECLAARVPSLDVANLRPVYVRSKPGRNWLVAYALNGRGLPALYAKAHRPDDAVKLEKARRARAGQGEAGDGIFTIDDQQVVVCVFPHDSKLHWLREIESDAIRAGLIERLGPRAAQCAVQPIRYKPERRFVAQLRDADGPVAALKMYTRPSFRGALKRTRAFHDLGPLRTASCAGVLKPQRTILFDWVPGRLLSTALAVDATFAEVEMVGAALAHIHMQTPSKLPVHGVDKILDSLDATARALDFILPDWGSLVRSIVERGAAAAQRLNGPVHALHGDFYAKQVLLNDGTATVLDFDRAFYGPPDLDIANFIAHLERDWLRGTIDRATADRARDALVTGYACISGSTPRHLDAMAALALLDLAVHPFRFREPDWSHATRKILERCDALVSVPPHVHATTNGTTGAENVLRPHIPVLRRDKDVHTPMLDQALDVAFVNDALKELSATSGNGITADIAAGHLIKHRPGRRFVIEYVTSDPDAPAMIGKARVRGLDGKTFALMRQLRKAGFTEGEFPVAVPAPLGTLPQLHMWLSEKVDGVTANTATGGGRDAHVSHRIGEALAALHKNGPEVSRTHTVDDELEILHARLLTLARHRPEWDTRLMGIFDECKERGQLLGDGPTSPLHRDFHAGNVLIAGDTVYLIDFDLYAMGDAAVDIGNYIGHLIERSYRKHGSSSALDHHVEAFRSGYQRGGGTWDEAAVDAYTTMTLARHLYLSSVIPNRSHATERLFDECERRLAQRAPGETVAARRARTSQ